MSENKIAKVPVASHGLHKHDYNYPWLSSLNFGDVMPCYMNTLRKGERDNPKAGVYSQLMPIAHNAFATGRYNFKSIFVPYKLVWRPWYSFAQQTEFVSDGERSTPYQYPYVTHHSLQQSFLTAYGAVVSNPTPADPNWDIVLHIPASGGDPETNLFYTIKNDEGRRVFRILGALGCVPSFVYNDVDTINILPILCYLKAYFDYYFPNNYVGNSYSELLTRFQELDGIAYSNSTARILEALAVASVNFYQNSVFDFAWDHPASPNMMSSLPSVMINDVTDPDGDLGGVNVNNSDIASGTPAVNVDVANKPAGFTQYILNALKSVSLWAKRHQLAGTRLLDRFLIDRGISLGNDSARISYFVGQRNIEIQVSGVENNTDTNLGELAGRGVASSGNEPLSFDCRPDDDGILFVIVSPLPDANFPILLDGFSTRKDYMDNYHAEFDKLGSAAVPARLIRNNLDGRELASVLGQPFGFLNQYWDEVQERPRLLGDFLLNTRGKSELSAYHTFRILPQGAAYAHSYSFIRMSDKGQYQRLFYSQEQDNLMLFLRWYGVQYKEKLPLGDSYEWDDDELNRKVSVVLGGSQK